MMSVFETLTRLEAIMAKITNSYISVYQLKIDMTVELGDLDSIIEGLPETTPVRRELERVRDTALESAHRNLGYKIEA